MKHLEEGTIHAWLDGALGADEAAAVERHFADCEDCAARVAEARGLVAGASRILSALDDVGAEIVPSRAPEVTRTRRRPKVTRVVAWLAAAGLLLAVGLETRTRTAGEFAAGSGMAVPAGSVATSGAESRKTTATTENAPREPAKPALTQPPGPDSTHTPAPKAAPVPVRAQRQEAAKAGGAPPAAPVGSAATRTPPVMDMAAGVRAGTTAAAAGAGAGDSAARRARMESAFSGLKLQDVVVTSVSEAAEQAPPVGSAPVCFSELPTTPAPMPVAAGAQRSVAGAATGAVDAAAANAVRDQPAPSMLMLDTTPVSPGAAGTDAPRKLLGATGVIGEWQLLPSAVGAGRDSLVLRFGQPPVRTMRGELTAGGGQLKVGVQVMSRVRCATVRR